MTHGALLLIFFTFHVVVTYWWSLNRAQLAARWTVVTCWANNWLVGTTLAIETLLALLTHGLFVSTLIDTIVTSSALNGGTCTWTIEALWTNITSGQISRFWPESTTVADETFGTIVILTNCSLTECRTIFIRITKNAITGVNGIFSR